MEDVLTQVSGLNRPSLLVRAAKHGTQHYNRAIHLCRTLKVAGAPGPGKALMMLMELEAEANQLRLAGRAEYSVAGHVELLVALMCEAQNLKHKKAAMRPSLEESF